jgi:hypothetical protein
VRSNALESHSFRYARGRPWQQVAYLAAVAGFVLLAASRTLVTGKIGAGWLSVVVLVGLGLAAFRGIIDRRPALVISDAGVWFRGWNTGKPIPWCDVCDVRYESTARGEPFITLDMHPEARRARSTYQFRTGMLDVRNDEAFALARKYWLASIDR